MLKAPPDNELKLSQYRLRQGIGWVGAFMPIAMLLSVVLFGAEMKGSLSAWYYQPVFFVFFVGPLWALGVYLFLYQGYDDLPPRLERLNLPGPVKPLLRDAVLTNIAGAAAIIVATIPTVDNATALKLCTATQIVSPSWPQLVHIAAAFTFFGVTAFLSLVYFTASDVDPSKWAPEKRQANLVFKVCGWTILLALALMALVTMRGLDCRNWPISNPIFWLETLCVVAFAVSWLVKGELVLKRHKT